MIDDPVSADRVEPAAKASELYNKAAKARRLADHILVEETRQRLLQYAAELEQRAAELMTEAGAPEEATHQEEHDDGASTRESGAGQPDRPKR